MCLASVVADDWITKGCHINVDGIELALRPDHNGGVVFRAVFSSPNTAAVNAAIRRAERDPYSDGSESQLVPIATVPQTHLLG
jgi:hypothetical protein